ncbi:MAG: hypothetical protein QXG05_08035 [Nitrososphaerota archaeon]
MVLVMCQRCKHVWDYKGKAVYASCPSCFTKVNVEKRSLKATKEEVEKTVESKEGIREYGG